ncbi:hypothetical protein ACS47_00095 [Bacillus cereus]|jgi:hypothetical protein|nr:hypothetical protein ACS47_00095 [Bacillus cereus]
MRIWILVAAVLALTALQAQAQGRGRNPPNETGQKADTRPKIDEKAYKAALERIPEPKDKYDPWSGARPPEPAKSKK